MDFRTDLAVEKSEALGQPLPDGVSTGTETVNGLRITRIDVRSAAGPGPSGR